MPVHLASRHAGAIEWMQRTLNASDAPVLDLVRAPIFAPGDLLIFP